MITLPQLPTWVLVVYGVFLFVVLAGGTASERRARRRPPVQHARRGSLWPARSNLWATGPAAGIPRQQPPVPAPAPAPAVGEPETRPLALPPETLPMALAGASDGVVRPFARSIPVPEPHHGTNGTVVMCPLCGGGRLAGRILMPPRKDCVWCGKSSGGVA